MIDVPVRNCYCLLPSAVYLLPSVLCLLPNACLTGLAGLACIIQLSAISVQPSAKENPQSAIQNLRVSVSSHLRVDPLCPMLYALCLLKSAI